MTAILHGGDVWRGAEPEEYLDFSANLNPDGPPDWVREAMAAGLRRVGYYPDVRLTGARRGLAAHLGLNPDCVLPTAGGFEAARLASALSPRPVIAQPTFQEYARLCGPGRSVPRDALGELSLHPGECLWLCNPNNPTGDALPGETVAELLSRAEAAGARMVVDEAFIDYCPEHSAAGLVADHPALIVLGSLTKVLAIPGLRLGYLAAHPDTLRRLEQRRDPWPLNSLAVAVAEALPGHEADFRDIRRRNDARRAAFAGALAPLAHVYPSDANFLLCDFGRDMRGEIEALREKKLLVRPCGGFTGLTHRHVRLCVRREAENERLIGALGGRMKREPP